jgi:hypothetical protein
MNNQYNHLSEAVNHLKERGFVKNFELKNENRLITSDKEYAPDEIKVEEHHRFEGQTNPADMSIIYALKASDGAKGIIIDSFNSDASEQLSTFLQQSDYK